MHEASKTFDCSPFLVPIGDDGVGQNPRATGSSSSAYSELKLAYEKLLEDEKMILVSDDPQLVFSQDWAMIADQGMNFLSSHAKDIEVASWTLAALARMEGFRGLLKGLELIKGLIESFSDGIFPLPKRENFRFRYIALFRLCGESGEGQLYMPLKSLPILKGNSDLTAIQYEQFSSPQSSGKKEELAAHKDAAKKAVRGMTYAEAKATYDTISASRQLLGSIFAHINQHFDQSSRVSENLSELLRSIQVIFVTLSSGRFIEQEGTLVDTEQVVTGATAASEGDATPIAGASAAPRLMSGAGPIASREDALKRLALIKDYFRQHEPHSPISYGIERICRWSTLTLPELIAELIQNENAKEDYINLTGIPEPEYKDGDRR